MKRVMLTVVCLLVLSTLLLPTAALAAEKKAATTPTSAAGTTAALIVYPAPEPDATAAEARAATPFMKPGDGLNFVIALASLGAVFAIIVWGIWASRKASAAR